MSLERTFIRQQNRLEKLFAVFGKKDGERNRKGKKKIPLMSNKYSIEPLEPRMLLSADMVLPGITASMAEGLISFSDRLKSYVEQDIGFQTAIPGILQVYQDVNTDGIIDDTDIHVPRDVSVKVDQDENGSINELSFVPSLIDTQKADLSLVYGYIHDSDSFVPTLEQKLDAMDRNNDMVVDWEEAYNSLFVGGVENLLEDPLGIIPTDGTWGPDQLELFLGIELPLLQEPVDLSSLFNLEVSAPAVDTDTGDFGHSYTLTLKLTDKFLIDLGIEAEHEEIMLPDTIWNADATKSPVSRKPEVTVSETITIPFAYHFGVVPAPTDSDPLTVDDFNFAAEKVYFSIDANESLENLIVNVGFLGTQAPAGSSFFLNMDYEHDVIDPSSPRNLGFADEEPALQTFRATETDGTLEAANAPRAADFNFTSDIGFTITIGRETYSPVISVAIAAADHDSIGDLEDYVEDAIDNALGSGYESLISVDSVDGKLRLNLVQTDPSQLGFNNEKSGSAITSDFDSPQIGRTSPTLGAVETFTFLLSLNGQVPKLVTVNAEPATLMAGLDGTFVTEDDYYELTKANLIDQVQAAINATGLVGVVVADGGSDRKISISTAGTLEITNTLKMEAVNNITNAEWVAAFDEDASPKPIDSSADVGNDGLEINLPLNVREGIDFAPRDTDGDGDTNPPTLYISVQPYDLVTEADQMGVERYGLPLDGSTDFDQYLDFNVMGPGEVIGLINQIISWLDRLTATEMLGNYRIPFAQAVLGDLLDFGDLIEDNLLVDDLDDGIQPADSLAERPRLLRSFADDPDSLVIVFGTAQELVSRLNIFNTVWPGFLVPTDGGSDGNATDDLADYNEDAKRLIFQLSLEHAFSYLVGDQVFPELVVPVDLDLAYLDLEPLNSIYSESNVKLTATGYFNAILSIQMGEDKTITDATRLDELKTLAGTTVDQTIKEGLALTGATDVETISGRLTADQTFTLKVTVLQGMTETVITRDVTVDKDDTVTNTELSELITDINNAIADAPVPEGEEALPLLSSLIEAQLVGKRIQLVAKDPASPGDPVVQSFELTKVGQVLANPYFVYSTPLAKLSVTNQSNQLGLNVGYASTVSVTSYNTVVGDLIRAMDGAEFTISINGETPISFGVDEDETNATLGDLVDDLNAAINSKVALAGKIMAAQSGGKLMFLGIDESVKAFELKATGPNHLGFSSFVQGENPAPDTGRLSDDAYFRIRLFFGSSYTPYEELGEFLVKKAATVDNNSLDDLIKDINSEIQSNSLFVDKIVAERGVGGTIVFRSIWSGGYGDYLEHFQVSSGPELGYPNSELISQSSQIAGISLTAENDVASQFGRLENDATFEITINGEAPVEVKIIANNTRIHTSIYDLVSDINDAIDGTDLEGLIKAETSGFRVVLRAIDDSVLSFVLTADPGDAAITELGFVNGQSTEAVLHVVASKDAPAYMGPGEDATFAINITGGTKAGSYEVTVGAFNSLDNKDIFSLVADVNRALRTTIGDTLTFDGTSAVDADADTLAVNATNLATGDTVVYLDGSGTAIEGLTNGATYYVIHVDNSTVKLATSIANALAGNAIDIIAAGTGADHQLLKIVRLDDVLLVSNDGNRLVFDAKTGSGITAFNITADAGDPAVTDLKLYDPTLYRNESYLPAPGNEVTFEANNWDLLIRTGDGNYWGVSLDGVEDVGGVRTRINGLPGDPVEASINDTRTGLNLKDNTTTYPAAPGTPVFIVDSVNGSSAAHTLGLFGGDVRTYTINDDEDHPDGLIEGAGIGTLKLADRLYLEHANGFTPILSADLKLETLPSPDGIESPGISMLANFGFAGVELTGGEGSFDGEVKLWLRDRDNPLTLASLLNAQSLDVDLDGDVDVFDLYTVLDFPSFYSFYGEIKFEGASDVNVSPALAEITTFDGRKITLKAFGAGDPFYDWPAGSHRQFDPASVVDVTEDTLTFAYNHEFQNGDKVVYSDGLSGSAIGGLQNGKTYYVIYVDSDTIKLASSEAGALAATPVAVNLTSVGTGDGHHLDASFEVNKPNVDVDWLNLDALANFRLITFEDFLPALQGLNDFLQQFKDMQFLEDPIPLLGVSFNELVNISDRFNKAVIEIEQNQAANIQLVQQKIRESFGLPQDADVFDLALVDDLDSNSEAITNDMLRITLKLPKSFNIPLPIGIDLSGVAGITEPNISLLGSAGLGGSGAINAKFTFGIDLSDPDEIFLFTHPDMTSITGEITAYSDNLAFNAALGQLGVFIKEGNADFDLNFSFLDEDATALEQNVSISDAFDDFESLLAGTADATFPVFYPTQSDYVGDIDYDATFNVSGTGGLATTSTTVVTSNPSGGFEDLDYNDFSIFDNLGLMVEAADMFLGTVQDILEGQVLNITLPIIGDKLNADADFMEELRKGIVQPFYNLIENTEEETGELIQSFLFALLGPGGDNVEYMVEGVDLIPNSIPGLGLLKKLNNDPLDNKASYTDADIDAAIKYTAGPYNDHLWDFVLGQTYHPNTSIGFDLGLDALGLDLNADLAVDFSWSLGLGFGISLMEGAYINLGRMDASNNLIPELDITVDAQLLDSSELRGRLLFLELVMDGDSTSFQFEATKGYADVTPVDDSTHFFAQFTVDLINQTNASDNKLGYSELGSLGVETKFKADAEVNLDLRLQFNESVLPDTIAALLPGVTADFVFDWQYDSETDGDFSLTDSLKYVAFLNVNLDLGSFLGDLVMPIVEKIQEVVGPIQPLVDVATAPIPVLSDIAGRDITLIDLADLFGDINPDLIYAIADIITFVNSIPSNVGSLLIPIADEFVLYGSGIVSAENLFDPNFSFNDIPDFDGLVGSQVNELFNEAGEFIGDLGDSAVGGVLKNLLGGDYNTETENGEYGFAFPILENPTSILGLLVGRPVTLITYDLPPFFMDFTWEMSFPIFPPLSLVASVGLGLKIDFAFGYDTQGIADFIESQNPLDLLSGLFVSDTDNPDGSFGSDVPELVFEGSIGIGAELNLGIASAGVKAEIIIPVNFDLYDPDRDGKVRITELVGNFLFELENGDPMLAPMAIFDISGEIALQLSAYIEILMARFDFEITPRIPLFQFVIPFERAPILATERGDGSLLLNIGPSSGARLNGNTNDIAEDITASGGGDIEVWGMGVGSGSSQTYSGDKIVAYGGEGDDVIDLSGVTVEVLVYGGGGNDIIKLGSSGGIVYGGLGDDQITGGSGNDIIYGEDGHDTIFGGGGHDIIFGDMGFITDLGDGKQRISCLPGEKDGTDTIDGEGGNDIIFGGGNDDKISGGANDDLIFGDGGRMSWVIGTLPTNPDGTLDFDDANMDGLSISTRSLRAGNDTIYGNAGLDKIFGSRGNDLLDGGADNDLLYGNEGFDTIYGGSAADTIYGGTEDDVIFGLRDPEGTTFGFAGETADGAADGIDTIYGENGNDFIRGNEENDVIYGNRGADIIFGDAGDDQIYGQDGPDIIFGGADNDIIIADTGNDIVFGDDGAVVYVDFYPASAADAFMAISSRVRRTADGDRLIGDGPASIGSFVSDGNFRTMDLMVTDVKSTDGDDIIAGGEGDDIVLGGAGHDWIGGDIPVIQTNADGSPALFPSGDIQLVSGDWVRLITVLPEIRPVGEDVLIGDGGRIELLSRLYSKVSTVIDTNEPPLPGNDHIFGDNGADVAFGGTANDVIYGGYRGDGPLGKVEEVLDEDENPVPGKFNDNDILLGDNGVIEYTGGIVKKIYTSDDNETTGGADEIYGKEGSDIILGGVNNGGEDELYGDTETRVFDIEPSDVVLGDNGELDFAYGDTDLSSLDLIRSNPYASDGTTILGGKDFVSGNQGNDVLIGGTGGDVMYGDNESASAMAFDGEDIMLGDNADIYLIGTEGRLKVKVAAMPTGTAVDLITTTDTVEATGGADAMSGNAKADIMFGGVFGDTMYGDREVPNATTIGYDGDDILLGDNGLLDFTFGGDDSDLDRQTLDLIHSEEDGLGGADDISGNKGLDVAIGGTAGDAIYGDDANASAAGADMADLLIGDNADVFLVPRGTTGSVTGDLKLVLPLGSATDAAVKTIRTTDEEHPAYGGSDTISGNAKGDIIAGGVAGDTIYGDRASEETTQNLDGNDIILGDNGAFEWLSTGRLSEIGDINIAANNSGLWTHFNGDIGKADEDLTTLDLVTTEQPNNGGRDLIYGDEFKDMIFGGTDSDEIYGDDGLVIPEGTGTATNDDLLFGDHGRLYPQFSTLRLDGQPWGNYFHSRNFFAIDVADGDGGEGDRMWGEEGDDTIIGQQGDDRMWGGSGDDDMTGGHNVSGGYDELTTPAIAASLSPAISVPAIYAVNDLMDGGTGNDTMAGDNAIIWRRGDDLSPRFRLLTAASLYTTTPDTIITNIGTVWQSDPDDAVGRDIQLVDHSDAVETTPLGRFGSDVMAGGGDSDVMFGELANDLMQGDGFIQNGDFTDGAATTRQIDVTDSGTPTTAGTLFFKVPEAATDADDYLEGNGGDDLMYGGLGQDDIIGGSSELYGLDDVNAAKLGFIGEQLRPDGSDVIFGGAGNRVRIARNDFVGSTDTDHGTADGVGAVPTNDDPMIPLVNRHSRDADFIMGDNANVFRPVTTPDNYLQFNFDQTSTYEHRGLIRIIPRAMEQLDYTLGGGDYAGGDYNMNGQATPTGMPVDNGLADLIYGESGDDIVFGMTGSDIIFGNSDDDDVIGGYGNDWISGGTGQDGVLGDDGLILTSRNSFLGEPLYGIAGLLAKDADPKYANGNALDEVIATPGQIQYAFINKSGELKKTADLVPFSYDKNWLAMDDEFADNQDNTPFADDIIFGGLGSDWLHGGSGDDAISGAEALEHAYVPVFDDTSNGEDGPVPDGILDLGYDAVGFPATVNPGDVLAFNPLDLDGRHLNNRYRAGEFYLYDEYNPLHKIKVNDDGTLWDPVTNPNAIGTVEFLLNFNKNEGIYRAAGTVPKATGQQTESYPAVNDDGRDAIFGDNGNDWLVGGTGADDMFGGWGNDLLNADDDQTANGGLNDMPDTHPFYQDRAYGGAGRDVLIANTGGDRLIDWVGEYNSYLVPYAPFGEASVSRTLQPFLPEFLYALSAADGADPTRYADNNGGDPEPVGSGNKPIPGRHGEPAGELGLVLQKDFAWQDQTGAPADPQAGNIPGGPRDVLRSAGFNDGTSDEFYSASGTWSVVSGRYQVEPTAKGGTAVSVFNVNQYIPNYFEMLATINAVKPTSGYNSNAYLVFDYQDDTDFKFAGINVSTNKLEIGYRDASGWHVVVQKPYTSSLKSDTDYNVFLALNGTNVILVVNNQVNLTYTFAPRVDEFGITYGLKDGMVGLGANNSKAKIDNVVVQRLPPQIAYSKTVDFSFGTTAFFDTPQIGTWSLSNGRYVGTAGTTPAIDLTAANVASAYIIDFSATFKTSGEGGFVYDQYSVNEFKYVTISQGKITLGHRTDKGWFTDMVYSNSTISTGKDYTLGITLKGTTVSVLLNNALVLSKTYNAVVTDGNFGLFSKTGVTSFDTVTFKTDDPAFIGQQSSFLVASAEPKAQIAGGAEVSYEALAPIVQEAIERLAVAYQLDEATLTMLTQVNFQIADLSGLTLGMTMGNTVIIDIDAAGYGWFIDPTPYDDTEFRPLGADGELTALGAIPAFGDIDLLTVVMHELGHVLGLADLNPETAGNEVMVGNLEAGVRHLPTASSGAAQSLAPLDGEAKSVLSGSNGHGVCANVLSGGNGNSWNNRSLVDLEARSFWAELKGAEKYVPLAQSQKPWLEDFLSKVGQRNPNQDINIRI